MPLFISGHVTVNGQAVQGASVSAGNSHTTTDGSGFYQLSPSVANGSGITVTASYDGHQQSSSVTQNMQGSATADFAITYSTATPTPTPAPTATPTATPAPTPAPTSAPSGGGGTSGVTVPTIIPTVATNLTKNMTGNTSANAPVNTTLPSAGTNVTATPEPSQIVHPAPDQTATAAPAPGPGLPGWFGQALPYLLVLLLMIAAGTTGYYLGKRARK
ncbi:carboxypeptidase-like regulatory domain-containing protein [Methanocella sp. MCL-LM]|uniref:carboxypeptidase-like regulatory domain-containing protein n=1 Tax=Methanocella sp. MCL-LM TaxID=3412035 RepID=UPI003C72B2A4